MKKKSFPLKRMMDFIFFAKKGKKRFKKKIIHLPISLKYVSLRAFSTKPPEIMIFGIHFEGINC